MYVATIKLRRVATVSYRLHVRRLVHKVEVLAARLSRDARVRAVPLDVLRHALLLDVAAHSRTGDRWLQRVATQRHAADNAVQHCCRGAYCGQPVHWGHVSSECTAQSEPNQTAAQNGPSAVLAQRLTSWLRQHGTACVAAQRGRLRRARSGQVLTFHSFWNVAVDPTKLMPARCGCGCTANPKPALQENALGFRLRRPKASRYGRYLCVDTAVAPPR
jgi:hypothetical protein